MRTLVLALILLAASVGPFDCAGLDRGPATPAPLVGVKVDIGDGRQLEIACAGSGTPTVILEHGHGADAGHFIPIIEPLAATTRVCAYNRLGAGGSSAPSGIRTASDAVDELEALLEAASIDRPLVLVGHSLGGFTIRLYAARHPDEVSGMVFIDPLVPGMLPALADAVGEPVAGEPPDVTDLRLGLEAGWPGPEDSPEGLDITASEREAAQVTSLGDIPVVVLSATELLWSVSEAGVEKRLRREWHALHEELATLSTRGRHEVVDGASHAVQADEPEIVIDAIRELVEAARG